jgi:hypothetical protein
MIFTLCGVPIAFALIGLLELPIYQKPLEQVTDFEKAWTDQSSEIRQLAKDRDYVGFVLYRMMSGIPSAIGGALAVSSVDVARYTKKKKELDDKN